VSKTGNVLLYKFYLILLSQAISGTKIIIKSYYNWQLPIIITSNYNKILIKLDCETKYNIKTLSTFHLYAIPGHSRPFEHTPESHVYQIERNPLNVYTEVYNISTCTVHTACHKPHPLNSYRMKS